VPEYLAAPNDALVTFIEAKKLVIYPMLLAQFVGIVHELKPEFLATAAGPGSGGFGPPHFWPALVCVGYLTENAHRIVRGYERRGYRLNVVPNLDGHASRLARAPTEPSPLRPPRDVTLPVDPDPDVPF